MANVTHRMSQSTRAKVTANVVVLKGYRASHDRVQIYNYEVI